MCSKGILPEALSPWLQWDLEGYHFRSLGFIHSFRIPTWLASLTQVGVILEGRWCALFDFIFLTLSTWLSHNPSSSNVSETNKVTLRNINKQIPRCTLNLITFIWSETLTFPPTCMLSVIFNRLQINLADRCYDTQGCGQFWEPTISHTA